MHHYEYTKGDREETEEFDLKSRHGCTDPLICMLFAVALVGLGAVFQWGAANGNVAKLYHGIDYAGRVCGVDPEVQAAPYLYWCATTSFGGQGGVNVQLGRPVCVQRCPRQGSGNAFADIHPDCAVASGGFGEIFGYGTIELMNRYCIPQTSDTSQGTRQLAAQLSSCSAFLDKALATLSTAWPLFALTFVAAVIMGYIFLVMLRHCAEPLIWLAIVASVVGAVAMGLFLWTNADRILDTLPGSAELKSDLAAYQGQQASVARGAAAACWVFAALLVVLAQCLHHSIHVAAACAEVACEAIFEMPAMLLAPLAKVAIKGSACCALVYGFLLLCSSCQISGGSDGVLRQIHPTEQQAYAIAYYVFMVVWILGFLSALYQFAVAYAVAQYYYTPPNGRGSKHVGPCALCEGTQVGLLFHAGSLALGSFLIALLFMLQLLIEYLERQNKQTVNNAVVRAVLSCLACLVACFKEFVQRVSRSAYIDMAITSNNFCDSASEALSVMTRVAASMGILTGATVIFAVFGVALIGIGSGIVAYVVSFRDEFARQDAPYYVASHSTVAAVGTLLGGMVAAAFMDIFDVTSDTLLYCYGLDAQSGHGGATAPGPLKELFAAQ